MLFVWNYKFDTNNVCNNSGKFFIIRTITIYHELEDRNRKFSYNEVRTNKWILVVTSLHGRYSLVALLISSNPLHSTRLWTFYCVTRTVCGVPSSSHSNIYPEFRWSFFSVQYFFNKNLLADLRGFTRLYATKFC